MIDKDLETRLFCGTSAKEETGITAGEWMSISNYESLDDFLSACYEVHKDEENPQFKFRRASGIFAELINANFVYEQIFVYYKEFEPSELIPLSYFVSDSSWTYPVKNYDVSRAYFLESYMGRYEDINKFIFDFLKVDYEGFSKELLPFLNFDLLICELFDPNPSKGKFIYRNGHIFKSIL